ncbi:TnsD family Tn7-like transposition protein [Paenibacillus sp. MCAF9]|uniref:TnsD family Tn7-like transposition protein n=1 Tax=Paenibacillus sp. MCAF9 TaxID=3233046 RepID=UPI003F9A0226
MLGFFPTPLPDEDFRSILYRYHLYAKNKEIENTSIELFGVRTGITTFPRGLDLLFQKLPSQCSLSIEDIIRKHTLLPWFLPFLSGKQQIDILKEIKTGGKNNESNVGKLAGNKFSRNIEVDIKYCGCCISEDINQYGTAYIHREHQFTFIHICRKHSVKLITHCNECGVKLGLSVLDGVCKYGHPFKYSELLIKDHVQFRLYRDLMTLYTFHNKLTSGMIQQRFLENLVANGYISSDGKIRRSNLVQDFLRNFSHDELTSIGLTSEHIIQRNTLERVFWGNSLIINLPLILMLIQFLSESLDNFLNKSIPYSTEIPFGFGPWPCNNKFCPDYNKMVIKRCKRYDNNYRGVTGKFYCETCESEYIKYWSWAKNEIEGTRHVFLSESKRKRIVTLLFSDCLSVKEIAERMFCSIYTVKVVAQSLSDSHKKNDHKEGARVVKKQRYKRESYRTKLEAVIKENPGLSRYQICTKSRTAYTWLKKNDAAWLEERLPISKLSVRLDWNGIDEALSKRVRDVAQKLKESNLNRRVSIYSILQALTDIESGRIKESSQLPKTQKMLQVVAETKEQYQFRHLPALVRQLRTHYGYEEVTIDTILSYRRSYRGINDETKELFSKRLREIQNI